MKALGPILAALTFVSPVLAMDPSANGKVLRREPVILPEDAPDRAREVAAGVVLERLIYASDGLEVEAFLASPEERSEEKRPGIVFLRGGNRNFGASSSEQADESIPTA